MGVVAARSARSALRRHGTVTTALKASLRAEDLRARFWASLTRGSWKAKEKSAGIPSRGYPCPRLRLFTTLFTVLPACFPPSFLAYYSDFTMLIWIMWIFALCFDWNSRTWFRKWREGGSCTPVEHHSKLEALFAELVLIPSNLHMYSPRHPKGEAFFGLCSFKT